MSAKEVYLDALVGRKVLDADGLLLGRLEELCAGIALDEGSEYVVREFHVAHHGALGQIAEGRFVRGFLKRLAGVVGYRRYVIPWELMDLTDPRRPRVRERRDALQSVTMR